MNKFLASPAKASLLRLVGAMGKSCAASGLHYEYNPDDQLVGLSPAMASLHGSLTEMLNWLTDIPPSDRSQARFGNPAFREWHERFVSRSVSIVHNILKTQQQFPQTDDHVDKSVLEEASLSGREASKVTMTLDSIASEDDREAITELCAYLGDSFGHPIRLDFGTGHESSFQVFLFGLCKLGCFGSKNQDEPPSMERLKAITISIYHAYLKVTRQLQTDYVLEPAGSHGVWGLDDYHCLPFYFGACQLQATEDAENNGPNAIHDDHVLQSQGDKYLYYGCVRYIKSLKKGVPFFESSPMLNDISNLPSWQKVAAGLLRLYEGEVLSKRQVVQHFVFGKLFAASWTPSESPREPPSTSTFRQPHDFPQETVAPMARAPWAVDGAARPAIPPRAAGAGHDSLPFTKAPWAK
ncbi:hypothetical protein ACA910_001387 [Epithemia clementina (nom. ined.)]